MRISPSWQPDKLPAENIFQLPTDERLAEKFVCETRAKEEASAGALAQQTSHKKQICDETRSEEARVNFRGYCDRKGAKEDVRGRFTLKKGDLRVRQSEVTRIALPGCILGCIFLFLFPLEAQLPAEGARVNRSSERAKSAPISESESVISGRPEVWLRGAHEASLASSGSGSGSEQEPRAGHWSLPNRPSLFSIIRFPNEECFDSSNQSGTCYTAFECKLLGGQPSSPCAAGFGSCCIVSRTCHVTTREKVVYFKNPSYPSADSDEKFCDLTVEMSDINVCQLRLDFLDFQLDPPTNGACKDDYMEISASGMPPQTMPRLCGLNRNQHRK